MRKSLLALALLAFTFVISACSADTQAQPARDVVVVDRIVDGDTVEVLLQGKKEKIRLIGVDTPETVKPGTPKMYFGKEASAYTKERLLNTKVALEWDVEKKDRYDRLLAYIWIGDELFNNTLVTEGYARIATYPPNVKYVDTFKKAQETARKAGKGIWNNYDKAFEK